MQTNLTLDNISMHTKQICSHFFFAIECESMTDAKKKYMNICWIVHVSNLIILLANCKVIHIRSLSNIEHVRNHMSVTASAVFEGISVLF